MERKSAYFDLVDIAYGDASLIVRVVELIKGEPDGMIGTPLLVGAKSRRYIVNFNGVTEFRSRAEPCFAWDGQAKDKSDFLCECVGSDYVRQICPFGEGAKEPTRHFVVFTETVVLEVLSSNEPTVELLPDDV